MEDLKADYFKYWDKADRDDPTKYHLLPYHCLDVAAVASVWWDRSEVIRRSFLSYSALDENRTKAWVLFFVSLHDYGKFDIRFQRKADHVRHRLNSDYHDDDLLSLFHSKEYDHGPAGLYWFPRDHGDRFGYNVMNRIPAMIRSILSGVPHTRGDEPRLTVHPRPQLLRSPHTWG
jgi:CRISPR-associated endonuclease/helicase Cas3